MRPPVEQDGVREPAMNIFRFFGVGLFKRMSQQRARLCESTCDDEHGVNELIKVEFENKFLKE